MSNARDAHVFELAALQAKLREAERALATSHTEAQALAQQAAGLKVMLAEREAALSAQAAMLAGVEQSCSQLQVRSCVLGVLPWILEACRFWAHIGRFEAGLADAVCDW